LRRHLRFRSLDLPLKEELETKINLHPALKGEFSLHLDRTRTLDGIGFTFKSDKLNIKKLVFIAVRQLEKSELNLLETVGIPPWFICCHNFGKYCEYLKLFIFEIG
jgi:hypothetical protein